MQLQIAQKEKAELQIRPNEGLLVGTRVMILDSDEKIATARLKKSRFLQNMVITDRFSEEMTYDKQGNILTLKRNNQGFAPNYTPQLIDNLTLSYNGNRLQSVTEAAPSYLPYGFVKPAGAPEDGQEYSYNKNGAMTKDFNPRWAKRLSPYPST